MNRLRNTLILTTTGLFVAASALMAGIPSSGSLERAETVRNINASRSILTKIYWKNGDFRIERYALEGQLVTIKHGSEMSLYDPAHKVAQKASAPPGLNAERVLTGGFSTKDGKKVGSATVAGFKCDVYSVSRQGETMRVSVSTDPRFPVPLRIETSMGSITQIEEIKNLKLNASIPDSMFRLPSGTKIEKPKQPASMPSPKRGTKGR